MQNLFKAATHKCCSLPEMKAFPFLSSEVRLPDVCKLINEQSAHKTGNAAPRGTGDAKGWKTEGAIDKCIVEKQVDSGGNSRHGDNDFRLEQIPKIGGV